MPYICKTCGNLSADYWNGYNYCSEECYRGQLFTPADAIKHKKLVTYFVKTENFVKIGSSNDPQKRLSALQVSCPHTLELIAVTLYPEKQLHQRFKQHHFRGEWFIFHQDIKDFIEHEAGKQMYLKECPNCKITFFALNSQKKHCCRGCKQEYYRKKLRKILFSP